MMYCVHWHDNVLTLYASELSRNSVREILNRTARYIIKAVCCIMALHCIYLRWLGIDGRCPSLGHWQLSTFGRIRNIFSSKFGARVHGVHSASRHKRAWTLKFGKSIWSICDWNRIWLPPTVGGVQQFPTFPTNDEIYISQNLVLACWRVILVEPVSVGYNPRTPNPDQNSNPNPNQYPKSCRSLYKTSC